MAHFSVTQAGRRLGSMLKLQANNPAVAPATGRSVVVHQPTGDAGEYWTLGKAMREQAMRRRANNAVRVGASTPGPVIAPEAVRKAGTVGKQWTQVPSDRAVAVNGLGGLGMLVPRFASTPVCGRSAPDSAPDFFPSALNPYWLQRSAMPYGRQLRGLGLVPESNEYADTWAGDDGALLAAAQADDVAGNGIFDGAGAPPTAHAGTGVFASSFSLPGYVYRERPTEPSEVRDTTTGMPVVYQPGPSVWYPDMREAYRPFDLEVPRHYAQEPVTRPAAVQGLGADDSGSSKLTALIPYFLLGTALALAYNYVSRK